MRSCRSISLRSAISSDNSRFAAASSSVRSRTRISSSSRARRSASSARSRTLISSSNSALEDEINVRLRAEEALRRARDELEIRVRERTEELAAANRELSDEIAERREIERQLRIQTAAMEAAANGIIITDPKGVMLWA